MQSMSFTWVTGTQPLESPLLSSVAYISRKLESGVNQVANPSSPSWVMDAFTSILIARPDTKFADF